jgi:Type I phosphodiesterase / nucleotide pyrophosphatase
MRGVVLAVSLLALAAPPALGQTAPLDGPDGTSLNKVLVIGTDGIRWDRLQAEMRSGRAANLTRTRRQGFGLPSRLEYGPGTNTLSEVGWSSVASGVWEDKHGVDGTKLNMDPGQATKNGYLDFLTRIEQGRPRLSTFIASDWDNLGLAENGGPIFGTAMDANFAARVTVETVEAWDAGDEQVTRAATRYLRRGNPDAGFVYLGVVDETAHLVGSATPAYARAIRTTDGRIGRLLAAVRGRPSYPFESWTVLVTTDHGQRPLTEPSLISHFFDTPLERTVFVIGSGPGLRRVTRARVVDVQPTVLHQLGLRVDPAWRLDGRSLSRARPPSSASASLRGGRLVARLKLGARPRGVRAVSFRLPAGGSASAASLRVNGRRVAGVRVLAGRRTLTARLNVRRLRSLTFVATTAGASGGGNLAVTLRGRRGTLGALSLQL